MDPMVPTGALRTDHDRVLRSATIRATNAKVVLEALHAWGSATRAGLSERTSLSRQALGPILQSLLEAGLIDQSSNPVQSRGRPAAVYTVAPRGSLSALLVQRPSGADISVSDALGEIIATASVRSSSGSRAKSVLEGAMNELHMLLSAHDIERSRMSRLTLAVDGLVDDQRHLVHRSPAWVDEDVVIDDLVVGLLPDHVELTVSSRSRAIARMSMAQAKTETSELVTVLQVDSDAWLYTAQHGVLLAGRRGLTGNISHQLIPGNDRTCACGRVGCFATIISSQDVDLDLTESSKEVGEPEELIGWLSRGIATMVQTIDPDRLILTSPWIPNDRSEQARLEAVVGDQLAPEQDVLPIHVLPPSPWPDSPIPRID